MGNQGHLPEPDQPDLVPLDTLRHIADAHAFELWGEEVGRGEPIPLSDAGGLFAYEFPYVRGARQFPPMESVIERCDALRRRFEVEAGADHVPADYYAELRRFARGFGSVRVSARYTDVPVLSAAHFLAPYFMLRGPAAEEARRRLGTEEATLRAYYFASPEAQYMEFESGGDTVLINACLPTRAVPEDAIALRPREPVADELSSMIRAAWVRRTTSSLASIEHVPERPQLAPGMPLAPRGLSVDDIATLHTVKKIAFWDLIPVVDHTPKNWCVPTSWAMVLGFYDNYVKGRGTFLGYGRLIDHWYELTPGGFNLPNLIDDLLTGAADTINGYTFPETKADPNLAARWQMLVDEVDAGRPCFYTIPGHCTAAFGYRIDNNGDRYAIVYDPPNPSVPTFVNEYNVLCSAHPCDGVGRVTLGAGTPGEGLILIAPDGGETFHTSVPNEIIWFGWGPSVEKVRVSASSDGGNTWQAVASDVPARGAWNGYAWTPATPGTRVRVKIEGFTPAGELVAADGSFKALEIKPSATGAAWQKIWGATDLVVAGTGENAAPLVYAVPSSLDGIYRYDGTPMAWTNVGGPGKSFALDDGGHLYGLSPDGGGVFRYDGTPGHWTQIGGPAAAIYAGGNDLFATNPQTGDVYQYSGTPMHWTQVGGPGKTFSVDRSGRLYGVSPDGASVFRYDGSPMHWTQVANQPTSAIYAGGCGLYAVHANTGDVYAYSLAPLLWTKIGGPGSLFAVDSGGRLYGLSPNADSVFRYDGAWNDPLKWTKVGGPAGAIFSGGDGTLYATNPISCDLMSYE